MKIKKNRPISSSEVLAAQNQRLAEITSSSRSGVSLGVQDPVLAAFRELDEDTLNPLLELEGVRAGSLPDPNTFNAFYEQVTADIDALFDIAGRARNQLTVLHNLVELKRGSIVGQLKTLRAKIATLKLYARDLGERNQYKQYSFTSSEELVPTSSSSVLPASHSEEEGAMMLPLSSSRVEEVKPSEVRVGAQSTGSLGNANRAERTERGDLAAVTDGIETTWVEYEKVTDRADRESGVRLVVEMNFSVPEVINRIEISPVNLGTTSWVRIVDIKASSDGIRLPKSLASDVSGPAWDTQDVFELSPSASRFAGSASFTIRPRKVQKLEVILEQKTPVTVQTNAGPKNRFVIALKGIRTQRVSFEEEGEFELAPITFPHPIRALGLTHNVSPFDNDLASIEYKISTGDSNEWSEIVALDNEDPKLLEVYALEAPCSTVHLRGRIKRKADGFDKYNLPVEVQTRRVEEIAPFPTSNSRIALEETPTGQVEIIKTGHYAVGHYMKPTCIGIGEASPGDKKIYYLPFSIPREDLRVLVNREEWTVVNGFTNNTSAHVMYDPSGEPSLIFGTGAAGEGRPVPIGAEVAVYAKAENPLVKRNSETGHFEVLLDTESGKSEAETMLMWRPNSSHLQNQVATLINPLTELQIPEDRSAVESSITVAYGENSYNKVAFKNGAEEFSGLANGALAFSFDAKEEKIYVNTPAADGSNLTVSYSYTLEHILTGDDLEYKLGENVIEILSPDFNPVRKEYDINSLIPMFGLTTDTRLHIPHKIIQSSTAIRITGGGDIIKFKTGEDYIPFPEEAGVDIFADVPEADRKYKYSIDYKGILSGGSGTNIIIHSTNETKWTAANFANQGVQISFLIGDIEAHYQAGVSLEEGRDWRIEGGSVVLSPDQITSQERVATGNTRRLLIRYDTLLDNQEGESELVGYYSPVVRDVAIIGVPVDPRLATLEGL